MSDQSAGSQDSLEAARLIDERCDQFEHAWQQGASPEIEAFLADISTTSRLRLLEELLLLEVFFRSERGDQVRFEDYASRFYELPLLTLKNIIECRSKPADQGNIAFHASSDDGNPVRYFGDFELLRRIAKGSTGVVYKARQIRLNRLMAVKVFHAGWFATEAEVRHFYHEAKSAAQLDHPNIANIYEVGECDGYHFVSMALVEGTSLATQLNKGPLELCEAATIARQVALAVQYAHGKGVIHGDLKPSNILLDAQNRPRVTAFGLTKRLSLGLGLTGSDNAPGTPCYWPPEKAIGKSEAVGPAADVYALGAVLYAILSGRPPFQSASSADTLRQVVANEPVPLRRLNRAVPRDLETIALKCLEKSIARRYASPADLAADLRRYLRGKPILARPTSRIRRAWQGCFQFLWTEQS